MTVVYVIDEEYHFSENVLSMLRIEGHSAYRFADASEAFEYFTSRWGTADMEKCQLLVDVSLAPGGDRRRFSPDRTDKFQKTGIILVGELMLACPGLCRSDNTVLYTAHYTSSLWSDILRFCKDPGFGYWQKRPDAEPQDIIKLVKTA